MAKLFKTKTKELKKTLKMLVISEEDKEMGLVLRFSIRLRSANFKSKFHNICCICFCIDQTLCSLRSCQKKRERESVGETKGFYEIGCVSLPITMEDLNKMRPV